MRKIKVVHICDKFGMRGSTVHGVSKLFAWWLPRYDADKFDVKLYAVKKPDNASRSLESDGVSIAYMGLSAGNPITLGGFMRALRQERADIVHLHGWIAANYGRLAGRMMRIPTIMHEHGVDPRFPGAQRMADRMLSPCTHTAVAVSNSVRDFLVKERSVPAKKIRVIYNGAPLTEFRPVGPEDTDRVRAEFAIPKDRRVVGTIGRLDVQKGITYLVKAAVRVLQARPDVHFVIVGDGPSREGLEAETRSLGIQSSFTFTGHRSDVPTVQSMFDVQAFPSLWEGTPLTVFEAMGTRRAIVSTDVDGLGEVLTDGRDAIIVKPGDPDQLSEGILRLLADPVLAERLSDGALSRSKDFDIGKTVRDLENLYTEILSSQQTA